MIPAQPADAGQYDNHNGGSGFMMGALDFDSFAGIPSAGDNRIAVWDWTGLSNLNSGGCGSCSGVKFGGQLFTGTVPYYDPENALGDGILAPQKAGPIPLGDECGAAGLSTGSPPPASCPEGGIDTNGDFMTQVSQAQGQLWGAMTTEVNQTFDYGSSEIHDGRGLLGGRHRARSTRPASSRSPTRDTSRRPTKTWSSRPWPPKAPAATAKRSWIFTLNGNGGPTHADQRRLLPEHRLRPADRHLDSA